MRWRRPDVSRFVEAQAKDNAYTKALEAIKQGKSIPGSTWYVFPNILPCGDPHDRKPQRLTSLVEAKELFMYDYRKELYWNGVIPKLYEVCGALLTHTDKSIEDIMGAEDAKKVHSCITIADIIHPLNIYRKLLDAFFGGQRCKTTQRMVRKELDVLMPPTAFEQSGITCPAIFLFTNGWDEVEYGFRRPYYIEMYEMECDHEEDEEYHIEEDCFYPLSDFPYAEYEEMDNGGTFIDMALRGHSMKEIFVRYFWDNNHRFTEEKHLPNTFNTNKCLVADAIANIYYSEHHNEEEFDDIAYFEDETTNDTGAFASYFDRLFKNDIAYFEDETINDTWAFASYFDRLFKIMKKDQKTYKMMKEYAQKHSIAPTIPDYTKYKRARKKSHPHSSTKSVADITHAEFEDAKRRWHQLLRNMNGCYMGHDDVIFVLAKLLNWYEATNRTIDFDEIEQRLITYKPEATPWCYSHDDDLYYEDNARLLMYYVKYFDRYRHYTNQNELWEDIITPEMYE